MVGDMALYIRPVSASERVEIERGRLSTAVEEGSSSLLVKAALVVAAHASPAAPQAGARRLRWPGSIEFTGSEEDPEESP